MEATTIEDATAAATVFREELFMPATVAESGSPGKKEAIGSRPAVVAADGMDEEKLRFYCSGAVAMTVSKEDGHPS
jgi:hypothetical protein